MMPVGPESYITDEIKGSIGVPAQPVATEIEKGAIKRFAEAIEDPNPLYQDEAYARQSRYGCIIAPPTFLRSVPTGRELFPFNLPLKRVLDGGSEWEYFEPVRPGDRIQAVSTLRDAIERDGRLGKTLFLTFEITYRNQRGQVAATQKNTLIYY